MADCSMTEMFFYEASRMCMYYTKMKEKGRMIVDECPECPITKNCIHGSISIFEWEEVFNAVKNWSDKNPLPKQKTYADVLFETFPFAKINKFGNPDVCMRSVVYGDNDCVKCAKKYGNVNCDAAWEEPYQKPEEKQ